jgi:glycosyltransferase involved in cell wall biosynthesis
MRLIIVQPGGDYREAYQRLYGGGIENYYAQKYSVDAVAEIAQKVESVTVMSCLTSEAYHEHLPNGVLAIGTPDGMFSPSIVQQVAAENPTHLLLRGMSTALLRWAVRNRISTVATFAESLSPTSLRSRLRNWQVIRLLNQHRNIAWVGCYGITAARQFEKMGVKTEKIIPWDFLLDTHPGNFPTKTIQPGRDWQLLYVGSLYLGKGIGDAIAAVAQLRQQGVPVSLKIIGQGDHKTQLQEHAHQLGVADWVDFAGVAPAATIEALMHAADAVLVPSWHGYPEGFPLVIQHALRSRTPLIVSDHPMFQRHLRHQDNTLMFPAQDVPAFANCIQALLSSPTLYEQISAAAHPTWEELRLPVKWADILHQWVADPDYQSPWWQDYSLTSSRYN